MLSFLFTGISTPENASIVRTPFDLFISKMIDGANYVANGDGEDKDRESDDNHGRVDVSTFDDGY